MKDSKKVLWCHESHVTNLPNSIVYVSFENRLGFGTRIETDSQLSILKNVIEIPENKFYNFCLLFYKAFSELCNFYPCEFDFKIVATKTHSIYVSLQRQTETNNWVKKCEWGLNIVKIEGSKESRVVFPEPTLFEYMQGTMALHLLYTIADKKKRLTVRKFLKKANLMNSDSSYKPFQIKKNVHNELFLLDLQIPMPNADLSTPLRNYVNRNFLRNVLKPKSYDCFKKKPYFDKYLDLMTCVGLASLMQFEYCDLCPYMQAIVYKYESRCSCSDCNG